MTFFTKTFPFAALTARMPKHSVRTGIGAVAAAAAFLALNAGCGGSNGNSSGQAHIRSLNLCYNGGTATIFINNGSTNGTQNPGQASGYLFLNGGSSTFTFTLGSQAGAAYPSINKTLTGGDFYTVFLLGNATVVDQATAGYPLLTVEQDDRTAPQAGNARVRIIQAAPDAKPVDVTVGSQKVAQDFSYGTIGVNTSTTQPVVGGPTGTYVDVPAGAATITIDAAGTTTPLQYYAPVTETLTAGHLYTISLIETTYFVAANSTATPPVTQVNPVYSATLTDDGT